MDKARASQTLTVGALRASELECIQTLAEGILDSIATIKAGRESVRGFLLKTDEENNIVIVKEVTLNIEQSAPKAV